MNQLHVGAVLSFPAFSYRQSLIEFNFNFSFKSEEINMPEASIHSTPPLSLPPATAPDHPITSYPTPDLMDLQSILEKATRIAGHEHRLALYRIRIEKYQRRMAVIQDAKDDEVRLLRAEIAKFRPPRQYTTRRRHLGEVARSVAKFVQSLGNPERGVSDDVCHAE
jgi:hypothetical protein